MKTNRSLVFLALLGACALVAAGCLNPFSSHRSAKSIQADNGTHATLKIVLRGGGKTVLPAMPSVASYTLLARTSGAFTTVSNFSSLPASTSIAQGTYDFRLEAKNGNADVVLAQTQGSVVVGSATVELAFTLAPISAGTGTVAVTVSWTGVTVASATTSFGLVGQTPTTSSATVAGNSVSYNATSVPSGQYFLTFGLKDGNGKVIASVTEVVRVYQNLTSSKTVSLTAADFNSPPASPSSPSATQELSSVLVTWTDASNNETGFSVERSGDNQSTWQVLTAPPLAAGSTSYTDSASAYGSSYHYRVRALNDFGASAYATTGQVTLTLAPLTSPTIGNLMPVLGGTFNNGTSDVTVSSFYMSQYEITQASYQTVTGTNPSYFTGDTSRPVEQVTWYDAVEYCNKLSKAEGLSPVYKILGRAPGSGYPITSATVTADWTKNGYRLPTEAEWIFSGRGGIATHLYTYSGSNTLDDVAWYDSNSGGTTHAVGGKAGNELGLFDMTGNVTEWCWDWYGNYPTGAQTDPTGPSSGTYRMELGGCWSGSTGAYVVTHRDYANPATPNTAVGFRVVRSASALPDTMAPADPSKAYSLVDDGQVYLGWIDPADSDFVGVEVSWTPSGGSPSQPVNVVAAGTCPTITGLSNGTVYTFTIKSVDATGNKSSGATVVAAPIAPRTSATIGTLVGVVGGTFNNGASDMTVSTFHMSQVEITQGQYQAVTGSTPSFYPSDQGRPVEQVTWYDAVEFCNKLSTAEGLSPVYKITGRTPASGYPITSATVTCDWTKNGYRLPTEAEWEFAARGGVSTHGYAYSGSDAIDSVAWYSSTSGNTTHPVGTRSPDELQVYDMSGNVLEWCWDWYGSYPGQAQNDPTGPSSGTGRCARGGAANSGANSCAVNYRFAGDPGAQSFSYGFRVVRSASALPDTTPPADPSDLVATASSGQVALSWTNPGDSDFESARITWSPSGGSPSQPAIVAAPGTSLTVTGLTSGTSYTFTIQSIDTSGNTGAGAQISATPGTGLIVTVSLDLGVEDPLTMSVPAAIAKGTSLEFSVSETFDSYQWYLDGEANAATNSGSIDTTSLSPGLHELSVFVLKSGALTSKRCLFTVEN